MNDGLRLPNRRHLNIGEGIKRLSEAVSDEDIQAISRPTLSLGGHLKTGHTWTLQNRPTK